MPFDIQAGQEPHVSGEAEVQPESTSTATPQVEEATQAPVISTQPTTEAAQNSEESVANQPVHAVPADVEQILYSGAAEADAESMDKLREAVRKAREAAGSEREALPPGFEDPSLEESAVSDRGNDSDDDALAVEQCLTANHKRKAEDQDGPSIKKERPERQDLESFSASKDPAAESMLNRAISSLAGEPAKEGDNSGSSSDSDDSDESSDSDSESDEDSSSEDEKQARSASKKPARDVDGSDDEHEIVESTLTTKNEIVDPKVELPPIQELNEADLRMIRPLGKVHSIVSSVVVVEQEVTKSDKNKAGDTVPAGSRPDAPIDSNGQRGEEEGEYSVLDTDSLLCFEDGKVLGLVFETFGSIHAPLYSVRFPSATIVNKDVIKVGKPVFYLPGSSTYVMTRILKAMKGSDASNVFDEEVGEDEIDYSDDEAEAEAKRRNKRKNAAKKGGDQLQAQSQAGKGRGQAKGRAGGPVPASAQLGKPFEGGFRQSSGPSLPPKPRPALPARPNFDFDVPPPDSRNMAGPSPGGRRLVPYEEASSTSNVSSGPVPIEMAVRQWSAKPNEKPNAGATTWARPPSFSGLPPKPAAAMGSPLQAQGASTNSASAISSPSLSLGSPASAASPQMAAGSSFASPVSSGSRLRQTSYPQQNTPSPFQSPSSVGGEGTGSALAGHYNPRFAGYWPQPNQAGWSQPPSQQPPQHASAGVYGQSMQGYGAATGSAYGGTYAGQQYGHQDASQQNAGYGGAGQPYWYGNGWQSGGQGSEAAATSANAAYAAARYGGYGYGAASAQQAESGASSTSYDPRQPSVQGPQSAGYPRPQP